MIYGVYLDKINLKKDYLNLIKLHELQLFMLFFENKNLRLFFI